MIAMPQPASAVLERDVMQRLALSWDDRVAVRKPRLPLDQYYDPRIPDFPIALIPFCRDPAFQQELDGAADAARLRYLAATWIAYNERVIFIEDDIVQPLCGLLRRGVLPGVDEALLQRIIAQVQVDEQFHTLMCLEVCQSARNRHALHDYRLPEPLLGKRLRDRLARVREAGGTRQDEALMRLAYATISEATIHDYLKALSSDTSIQPLNRAHTDLHRRDETAHGAIFLQLARSVYLHLNDGAQARLREHLNHALADSVEIDLGFWASTLPYLRDRDWSPFLTHVESALAGRQVGRDYTGLLVLLDELGIRDRLAFAFPRP
ncbi:hypothetical protein ANDO1_2975 [plant metagenome]|uniref:p-aminobenzoate N-oxygenase AurF n=1 Tax=plant metagenome TaxID=1297885 RepID=A0A484Q0C1_9ZZZZ